MLTLKIKINAFVWTEATALKLEHAPEPCGGLANTDCWALPRNKFDACLPPKRHQVNWFEVGLGSGIFKIFP